MYIFIMSAKKQHQREETLVVSKSWAEMIDLLVDTRLLWSDKYTLKLVMGEDWKKQSVTEIQKTANLLGCEIGYMIYQLQFNIAVPWEEPFCLLLLAQKELKVQEDSVHNKQW